MPIHQGMDAYQCTGCLPHVRHGSLRQGRPAYPAWPLPGGLCELCFAALVSAELEAGLPVLPVFAEAGGLESAGAGRISLPVPAEAPMSLP